MQSTIERLRARRERLEGREGGFTLIELLIVIVILAILAAIVVFAVQNLSSTSAQASCTSDYKTVQTAVEAYKSQMGSYPHGDGSLYAAGNQANTASSTVTDVDATTTNAASVIISPTSLVSPNVGGELMTGSNIGTTSKDATPTNTNNLTSPSGSSVGPWLKTVPVNGNHYGIWVSNDGKGTITVDTVSGGVATATPLPDAGNAALVGTCGAVS
jgi:general secretion pathway protein G